MLSEYVFVCRRCMGVLIRHIHNRDLAAENIMTAYVRMRMMMSCSPGSIGVMLGRLDAAGITLASDRRSMLVLAHDMVRARGSVAGDYGVHVKNSRRNSKTTTNQPAVVRALLRLGRNLVPVFRFDDGDEGKYVRLTAGVALNGRAYGQGL
jgi:hypothetical protein